jgi:hypothetical protein
MRQFFLGAGGLDSGLSAGAVAVAQKGAGSISRRSPDKIKSLDWKGDVDWNATPAAGAAPRALMLRDDVLNEMGSQMGRGRRT